MKHSRGSLLVVLAIVLGCAIPEEENYSESEVRSNIRFVLDGMGAAAQNKDVDGFMTFWVRSDSLVYTRQGKTFLGWEEVEADAARSFPNLGDLTSEQTAAFIHVLGPSAAVATTFTFLSSVGDDGATVSAWFTFTATIAKLSDDRWQVVQAHSSYPESGMSPRGVPEG